MIAPPFDVGPIGKMGVFQDPTGAFISIWQSDTMPGVEIRETQNAFAWAELNARGFGKAKPFYQQVFGWGVKESPLGEGQTYTEWQLDDKSVAGGMEMAPVVPAEVPSHWLLYFEVDDVDAKTAKAHELGATILAQPMDFPGGRFSIVQDPQGAVLGIVKSGGQS